MDPVLIVPTNGRYHLCMIQSIDYNKMFCEDFQFPLSDKWLGPDKVIPFSGPLMLKAEILTRRDDANYIQKLFQRILEKAIQKSDLIGAQYFSLEELTFNSAQANTDGNHILGIVNNSKEHGFTGKYEMNNTLQAHLQRYVRRNDQMAFRL